MLDRINRIERLSGQLKALLDMIMLSDELSVNINSIKCTADVCIDLQNQIDDEIRIIFDEWKKDHK